MGRTFFLGYSWCWDAKAMLKSFKAIPISIFSELPEDLLEGVAAGVSLDRWKPGF